MPYNDPVCYSDNEAFVPVPEGNANPFPICLGLCESHEAFYFFDIMLHVDMVFESVVQGSFIDVELPDVPASFGCSTDSYSEKM